ncbi:DUF2062 domain-containing protein [Paenibacillus psychroresistens]|uniref:DUF2062 domain-containing protein n=1 Tax=Paenibacillus psychroresistens TaxID=1778678 RepID=A0A6B8RGE9_9BACL|nr:DUF2062 domain-containing protein [Paenibacillus psychroresistens]QGQ95260.1 DUF2062 domain-containing protein [Paenibacillus psychroresistens]
MKFVKKSRVQGITRWFRLKYNHLLRAKGGPSIVAKGFSIGLFIEMFTFPTFGLAAVLILPLVYFTRASLSGALVGFLFGKIIYLPFFFLIKKMGHWLLPSHFAHHIHFHPAWLSNIVKDGVYLILGGIIMGAILGLIAYFPVRWILEVYAARRKEKRKRRKAVLASLPKTDADTLK